MADWSLPALTSTYTNTLTEIKNRDIDLALQFDGTTSTNLTTGTIRWNSSANTWQKWSGSAWGALSSTFAFPVIATTGAVGVGTTPTTTLDVAGGMVRNGSASGNNLIQAYSNSGSVGLGMWSGGATRFYSTGNMTFGVNATIGTGIPTGYTDAVTITGSGQVGIGTSSPAASLDIAGNQLFSAANPQIQFNAGGPIIRLPSANTLAFLTDSTNERLRIDSSGRVGIGTSSPQSRLDFGGGTTAASQISWHTDASTSYANIWSSYNGGRTTIANGLKGSTTVPNGFESSVSALWGRAATELDYGVIKFYTDAASTVAYGTAITPTERLRIDSSGRLGIATTSPAVTLDVNAVDAVRIASGTTAQRPTGAAGMIRYNSSLSQFEGYGTAWGTIGGGAKGSGSDQVFFENDQAVTTNYTITTNKNAMTAGPVTINSGITVTIPSGSSWSIV